MPELTNLAQYNDQSVVFNRLEELLGSSLPEAGANEEALRLFQQGHTDSLAGTPPCQFIVNDFSSTPDLTAAVTQLMIGAYTYGYELGNVLARMTPDQYLEGIAVMQNATVFLTAYLTNNLALIEKLQIINDKDPLIKKIKKELEEPYLRPYLEEKGFSISNRAHRNRLPKLENLKEQLTRERDQLMGTRTTVRKEEFRIIPSPVLDFESLLGDIDKFYLGIGYTKLDLPFADSFGPTYEKKPDRIAFLTISAYPNQIIITANHSYIQKI